MKLSEIKGERVYDVIADLIVPIVNIAEDKDAASLFERQAPPDGVEARDFVLARFKRAMPKLLKAHKGDLTMIMATLKGVTPEEYIEGLDLSVLFADILELMDDEEFLAFLA